MEIVTLFLLLCVLVKIVAIVSAIRWIGKHGAEYRRFVDQLEKTKGSVRTEDFDAARDSCHADFFPYGLKEFRLRQGISRLRGGPRLQRIAGVLLAFYYRFLVQYHYLGFLITGYLILLPGMHLAVTGSPITAFHAGSAYVLSLLLLAMNMAIEVEVILGYATLGGYGRYFHMLTTERMRLAAGSPFLVEVGIAAAMSLVMLVTGAGACSVAYVLLDGFGGEGLLKYNACQPVNWGAIYLQCVYFALTTLTTVGYGDIAPRNGFGQLTTALIMLQNFIFLALVITTIVSVVKAAPP
jgi:hypothetical protein